MNKILKRDEFIEEVYNPMIEQKEYEELVSINEGLLKTLFGAVKNLFVQDWKSIKGDPQIIKIYKELDDALTGFSMMKLSKKKECNQIRQELVDFACDWYDKKMNDAKKDDVDPKPAKGMKFRDETLKSNLEATQDKINTICGEDAQMKKWANMLMSDMKVVINRSILEDMKDQDAKDELEAKNKEDMEKLNQKHEKTNKEMEKLQNDQLKEVKKERDKIINDMNATPICVVLLTRLGLVSPRPRRPYHHPVRSRMTNSLDSMVSLPMRIMEQIISRSLTSCLIHSILPSIQRMSSNSSRKPLPVQSRRCVSPSMLSSNTAFMVTRTMTM